jgi:hypothetical protein
MKLRRVGTALSDNAESGLWEDGQPGGDIATMVLYLSGNCYWVVLCLRRRLSLMVLCLWWELSLQLFYVLVGTVLVKSLCLLYIFMRPGEGNLLARSTFERC